MTIILCKNDKGIDSKMKKMYNYTNLKVLVR